MRVVSRTPHVTFKFRVSKFKFVELSTHPEFESYMRYSTNNPQQLFSFLQMITLKKKTFFSIVDVLTILKSVKSNNDNFEDYKLK